MSKQEKTQTVAKLLILATVSYMLATVSNVSASITYSKEQNMRGQRGEASTTERDNVSLREWAKIVDVKDSYAYEQSRHNKIPGIFRVGKFVRVHLPTFYRDSGLEVEALATEGKHLSGRAKDISNG